MHSRVTRIDRSGATERFQGPLVTPRPDVLPTEIVPGAVRQRRVADHRQRCRPVIAPDGHAKGAAYRPSPDEPTQPNPQSLPPHPLHPPPPGPPPAPPPAFN